MAADEVPLALYLWRRIFSLGTEHIFGVPGDFNLTMLDYLYHVPGLKWLGTCNELNGAYAADGYARVKGTPGVLLTTYAVGELSAMNGIAGAYAEHAGIIHIVGMPSRQQIKSRPLLHHTLEPNMDQQIYVKMSEPIRRTHTVLMNDATMSAEIDRVIIECVRSRLPVYIYVPTDVVTVRLDASHLETPLDHSINNSEKGAEDLVVSETLKAIKNSENPAILADVLAIRHGGQDLVRNLVELTNFPSFSTLLAKGVIDENSQNYNGVYSGKVSFPGIKEAVESSDLVINIGPLLSDSNTGGFTRDIPTETVIVLAHDYCQVRSERFDGLHFIPVLKRVVGELKRFQSEYRIPRGASRNQIKAPLLSESQSGLITQAYLWQRIGRYLKRNDIVLAESGTAQFGIPDATFPENVHFITQVFWSSIGFTVGAALGACVAAREQNRQRRVILVIGDGSLQMTVQEIGSLIRFGFKPVIIVINNAGYSIERAIHGEEQGYNDISPHWDYQQMLSFFGANSASGIKGRSIRCRSIEDVEMTLNDDRLSGPDCIQVCEIIMDKLDYPWRLSAQLEIARSKVQKTSAD